MNYKEEPLESTTEETVEGLEITVEKATELSKEEFFNILSEARRLDLTIDRIGKTYVSKWKNDKNQTPSGTFIDYSFTYKNNDYEVGIAYNLGVPIANETFKLTSGMNIFKILAIAVDLSKAEEIKVTKEFIEDTLTGIKFKAKIGAGFNSFIIDPVELIK